MGQYHSIKKMRAIYIKGQEANENIEVIDKETLHHLNNVIRLQAGDKILVLNGSGLKNLYLVKQVERKKISLSLLSSLESTRPHLISIAIGLPKKEYFEDILRSCIQLGVNEVFYFESENSPKQFKINDERMDKILKASYEQSNNPFELKLTQVKNRQEIVEKSKNYQKYIMCVPNINDDSTNFKLVSSVELQKEAILVIGPEGGLSSIEEKDFLDSGFSSLSLPSFILKSTEALPAGIGALLGASTK